MSEPHTDSEALALVADAAVQSLGTLFQSVHPDYMKRVVSELVHPAFENCVTRIRNVDKELQSLKAKINVALAKANASGQSSVWVTVWDSQTRPIQAAYTSEAKKIEEILGTKGGNAEAASILLKHYAADATFGWTVTSHLSRGEKHMYEFYGGIGDDYTELAYVQKGSGVTTLDLLFSKKATASTTCIW